MPTRQAEVLEALRSAILTCELRPGSRLVQEELATRLGVSRIPLREAFRTLHGEGLIIIEANRGAVVRPLEAKDLSDLYDVRLSLETLAGRTAAERFVNVVRATAVKRQAAEHALGRRDLRTLIAQDCAFHSELAHSTGNEHLAASLDGSWSQIMRAMHFYLTIERYPQNVWAEHTAIARAVSVGDGELAARLLEHHIVASRNVILSRLKEADHERAVGR